MRLTAKSGSRVSFFALLMGIFVGLLALPAMADVAGVGLGMADNFAVLEIGGNSTILGSLAVYQSGTVITGDVGNGPLSSWGHTIDVNQINGAVFYDTTDAAPTVTGTITGGVHQVPMGGIVADALAASAAAAALTPTQTFATLTSGQTITGTSGVNVIRVTGDVGLSGGSTTLNLAGPADAQFVFQLTAADGTSAHTLTLSGVTMNIGAISADNIVWSMAGTGGGIVISSSATVYGTFLAPDRSILVDNGTVVGAVIGGGGTDNHSNSVDVHSSSTITLATGGSQVPEPSFLPILSLGLIGGVFVVRKRTAQAG